MLLDLVAVFGFRPRDDYRRRFAFFRSDWITDVLKGKTVSGASQEAPGLEESVYSGEVSTIIPDVQRCFD